MKTSVMSPIKMNLIKEFLKEQGLNQKWHAEKIGKSYVLVTNNCDNNSEHNIEVLRKIAEVLDIDVRYLPVSTK